MGAAADNNLFNAVIGKDLDAVQEALTEGADPHMIGLMNAPLLMTAISNESGAIVQALLQAGANPNHQLVVDLGFGSPTTDTPLKRARDTGNAEIIELLLKHGATDVEESPQ